MARMGWVAKRDPQGRLTGYTRGQESLVIVRDHGRIDLLVCERSKQEPLQIYETNRNPQTGLLEGLGEAKTNEATSPILMRATIVKRSPTTGEIEWRPTDGKN